MALVPAICTQCGAQIEVDDTHEAGICKHCGTAFVTEKVINKYTLNISNANINVLNGNINNFILLGKQAETSRNYDEANNYFSKALEIDPTNREALLGKGINSTMQNDTAHITANNIQVYCKKALDDCTDEGFLLEAFNRLGNCSKVCLAAIVELVSKHQMSDAVSMIISQTLSAAVDIDLFVVSQIERHQLVYNARFSPIYIGALQSAANNAAEVYSHNVKSDIRRVYSNIYNGCKTKLFNIGANVQLKKLGSSGGCYIATCIYGSYDCPQVWTLRRFRDYTLDCTWYGRAFIKCYYAISPTLVKWFGQTKWFRFFWKKYLDKMIYMLNQKGIDDMPYVDKY